ncbi:MAG: N-acetylmuramoyl-L-alanine amidase [Bacteroidota bacterium]
MSLLLSTFEEIPVFRLSLLLLIASSVAVSQTAPDSLQHPKTDSLFLRVVVPGDDTVRAVFGRHRIAASTLPNAKAFINGQETKVYASGAFVGMVQVPVGTSPLRLTVKNAMGDSLYKDFVFVRPEPPKTSSKDTVTIEKIMMEPSQDLWLGKDDVLEVKFKGSPGYEASFEIDGVESGIPMRELPAREANGLGGIYVGRYKIKDGDVSNGSPIRFKLRESFWCSEKAYSRARVWIIPDSLPRVAEVTGRRPFLNAGLGADRLGGAKLGYIQPGVLVEISGKVGRQYRVRLSESMEGWLPEESARLLPPDTPLPRSLTGSISAAGNDSVDIVTVSLSKRLPYTSDQQVNPNAVIVDVYGATSNTNWITHQLSAKGIESVKWNQVSAEQYRLTINLKYRQQWGYDIDYNGGTALRIRIRRPPVLASRDSILNGLLVAVDAGHGGDNQGALGATGVREMDVNLAIVNHIDSVLRARGAQTVLTRTGDEGPSMLERTDKVLSSGAQVLISIHCNSTGEISDPLQVSGTSTYYRYVGFKLLANGMYDRMLELGLNQFGITGSFNFSLNGPTQLPNVLVETAFLSNPEDEMLLLDDGFRTKIAVQVIKGLEDFLRKATEQEESETPTKIGNREGGR